MLIPEEKIAEVEKKFRVVFDYKEDARENNRSANEVLNSLAELLDSEHSKESIKKWKKIVRKSYKQWQELIEGDDSTDEASVIANRIVPEEEV